MSDQDLENFFDNLKYEFQDIKLLRRALTHSSTEQPNNESLEFLGDTVLCTVVSDYLFNSYPEASEGELTIRRSQIINNRTIYRVALAISISDFIIVGKSFPKSNRKAWRNLLANTVESVIGAIYLDGGIDDARKFILYHFHSLLDSTEKTQKRDSKSKLQEHLQSRSQTIPVYTVIEVSGEKHNPLFTVTCKVECLDTVVTGRGSTTKEAEQDAAALTYEFLCQRDRK